MIKESADRVPESTSQRSAKRIEHKTHANIARYECGDPALIQERLQELDAEWDIERALETSAASFSLVGILMSALRGRSWLMLPSAVGIFLLQHAVQGWCPPATLFRRLGFRTRKEIDQERYGLKVLRGDFQNLPIKAEKERLNLNLLYTALKR